LRRVHARGVVFLATVVLAGCSADRDADVDTSRPSEFGFQRSVQTSLIEEGRAAYGQYCTGCHGAEGDGKGDAAVFLNPKPRNFQLANFRFSSTRSGRLPTDEDLKRTLREGLKGSAMPGWDFLPPRTVNALVAYLKTFSPKWEQRGPSPEIPRVENPYGATGDKSSAIARGEAVYHGFATCWTCHPAYVPETRINELLLAMENPSRDVFRPRLFESEGKENSEGELIFPPDFRRDFVRSGADVEDLYRSIAAGITGTAMPTWVDSMDYTSKKSDAPLVATADIWAMAYYVQSLILSRPAKLAEADVVVRDRPQLIHLHGEPPKEEQAPRPPAEEEFAEEEVFEE